MTAKQVLYLVAIGLLIGLSVLGLKHIKDWYDLRQTVETQGHIGKAATGIETDASKADADREQADNGIKTGRNDFQNRYQRDIRDDAETATHSTHVVPKRVRDNFRERRLARERSGCAGAKCQPGSEEDNASQR